MSATSSLNRVKLMAGTKMKQNFFIGMKHTKKNYKDQNEKISIL